MDIILIYVTHTDQHNADKVSDHLFHQKLIASVNSRAINNTYVWKGGLEKNQEIVTLYKTKPQNWLLVKEAIKSVHPDDTPCIIKLNGTSNHAYANWVMESVV
ncbi:Divalent-cation tolerance protein CutA [candidate division SR1 bacterium Aalborg_AAW-1]|nr:Divalent-cation tolerance protein CutA [candidate division SR1 bacterium Aalborg_AAW-1]